MCGHPQTLQRRCPVVCTLEEGVAVPEAQAQQGSSTWIRRLWQMSHTFTASGYVSRMYCSISRMARLCRVNSPSFCRDRTGGGHLSLKLLAHQILSRLSKCPLQSCSPRPRKAQRWTPHTLPVFTNPATGQPRWPLGRASSRENLGKDLKGTQGEVHLPPHALSTFLMPSQM